jgi:hypothetical protein
MCKKIETKLYWIQQEETMSTKRADLQEQIRRTTNAVRAAVSGLEPHPFGHAFLWGNVSVTLKNGKTKQYRECLGSVCAADLGEAVRRAESVVGVSGVYYNLD